jgi:tetratricopeptide (TPR) repeat protein
MTNKHGRHQISIWVAASLLSAFAVTGCSEESSTSSTNTSNQGGPPKWRQNYDKSLEYYKTGDYKKMIPLLEESKDEARAAVGGMSVDWGDYETRLARAYYFAGDYAKCFPVAQDAVKVLQVANAGTSNRYRANWFAGCSAVPENKYDEAMPYLREALALTKETDSEWNMKNGLSTLYDRLIQVAMHNNDNKKVDALKKEKEAALKAKGLK